LKRTLELAGPPPKGGGHRPEDDPYRVPHLTTDEDIELHKHIDVFLSRIAKQANQTFGAKNASFAPFLLKRVIVPRHVRDKHRVILKKRAAFFAGLESNGTVLDDVYNLLMLISDITHPLPKYRRPCVLGQLPLDQHIFLESKKTRRRLNKFDAWVNSGGKRAIREVQTSDGRCFEQRAGKINRFTENNAAEDRVMTMTQDGEEEEEERAAGGRDERHYASDRARRIIPRRYCVPDLKLKHWGKRSDQITHCLADGTAEDLHYQQYSISLDDKDGDPKGTKRILRSARLYVVFSRPVVDSKGNPRPPPQWVLDKAAREKRAGRVQCSWPQIVGRKADTIVHDEGQDEEEDEEGDEEERQEEGQGAETESDGAAAAAAAERVRAPYGDWTAQEDELLVKWVTRYGACKWGRCAAELGTGRTGNACQGRYRLQSMGKHYRSYLRAAQLARDEEEEDEEDTTGEEEKEKEVAAAAPAEVKGEAGAEELVLLGAKDSAGGLEQEAAEALAAVAGVAAQTSSSGGVLLESQPKRQRLMSTAAAAAHDIAHESHGNAAASTMAAAAAAAAAAGAKAHAQATASARSVPVYMFSSQSPDTICATRYAAV